MTVCPWTDAGAEGEHAVGAVATLIDVTQRKLAEDEQRLAAHEAA